MKTYQFALPHAAIELVIDVDAETRGRAVIALQNLIATWIEGDDPSTLDITTDGVYARVWPNLKPEEIGPHHIIEEWSDP